jgi:ABC-2 type transport system permease protein
MLRRILAIIQKETSQILRDGVTLAIAISMPLILLILFGFAISMNVKHIPTVVADQSMDADSRAYLDSMINSGYFDIVKAVPDQAAVRQAMDSNEAKAGVIIPPDFSARLARGDATVQVLVDGSDPFVSLSAQSYAGIVGQMYAIQIVTDQLDQTAAGAQLSAPLVGNLRILYNPDLKDLWFVIPGLIAMLLQVQSIVLVVTSIVREREMGTMEQILVTPIRPLELLIGKMIPNIGILGFNLILIMCMAVVGFGVPFRGNLLLFVGLVLLYVMACVGLGLLISTVAENQTQAFQINMMMTLIALVVSGFIFPLNSQPRILNFVGRLFPLTYFVPIARGVILKGIGLEMILPMVGALFFYLLLILFLTSKTFKQRID